MPNNYLPPVITSPSSLDIASMSQSMSMVVVLQIDNDTTQVNNYIVGMAVRLFVPRVYGMYQANNVIATIIGVDGLTFTLGVNSTNFDPFVIPDGNTEIPASIAPAGSRNLQYDNTNINIVPFRALNNIGN